MTETKTKILEVFVDISSYTFRQPVVTYRENAHAQPTAVHTAYCVIASNSVFSNIIDTSYHVMYVINLSESYLVWLKLKVD